MKRVLILSVLFSPGIVFAQAATQPDLGYSYAELRYVDTDENGGDGLQLGGSYDLGNNWLIVGSFTDVDYNFNVDQTTLEIGGGYVYAFDQDFDLVSTVSVVDTEIDTPGGSADDSGVALSAGVRGLLTPQFEVRGSVNHVNLDNSDTYLEVGGDYHFTPEIAAGVTAQLAGDNDLFTIGARWFFR